MFIKLLALPTINFSEAIMPQSDIFASDHEAAYKAHTDKQWQRVIDLLMPIIPQLSIPSVVDSENELEVKFYADCNYLMAYSLRELNKPIEALPHAQEALRVRQIMPEHLRIDEEDDVEQVASQKLVQTLLQLINGDAALIGQGFRFYPPRPEALDNTSQQDAAASAAPRH